MNLNVDIGDELVERIAERAAELIVHQQGETAGDGWLRGADRIADYIDSPRSRVYALASARRIPVHHDGSALIARRSELDAWLLTGAASGPNVGVALPRPSARQKLVPRFRISAVLVGRPLK